MASVTAPLRDDKVGLGIGLTLLAWGFFAATDITVKWVIVMAGLPALQLAFMRYAVSLVLAFGSGATHGHLIQTLSRRDTILVTFRASLLVLATALNFIALKFLALSVTSTILNMAPIFVTLLAIPLLGERVGPWRIGAVCVGFIGALIIIRPGSDAFQWAILLPVINAVAIALFSILTRQMAGRITPQTQQVFVSAIGTIALLPFAVVLWQSPETLTDWLLMISVGLWAWTGHELFARAHLHAEATVLSPFGYILILYMTLGGYILFDNFPDAATLLGAAIIIASGLLIWWRETRKVRQ